MSRPKGSKLSNQHIKNISEGRIGQFVGNKSPSWKGGISKDKKHLKYLHYRWYSKNYDKVLFSNLKRRSLKKNAIGSHTFGDWENLKAQYN